MEANLDSKTEPRLWAFGAVASAVTLAVPAGLVVSIFFDFGFFSALGLSFVDTPTSIGDHFRTGIIWFPIIVLLFIGYLAVEFQIQRVEKGLTEQEIVDGAKNPEKTRRFRAGPYRLVVVFAPVIVVFYLLIGDVQAGLVPAAASITWMIFSAWCNSSPLILLRRPKVVRDAFIFGPIIVIVAYFSGYNKAIEQALTKPELIEVESDDGTTSTFRSLRAFENGFLVINQDDEIRLLSWGIIRSYSFLEPYKPFRGIICEWFDVCSNVEKAFDSIEENAN